MTYPPNEISSTSEASISKPTFLDIARSAGVGTATVERVLNGRGGVRPALVEKVITAARSLGYARQLPEVHRGLLRIEVILVRPETTFFSRLSDAIGRIAATLDPSVSIQRTFMDEHNAASIAERISDPEIRRAGLILAVPDHPLIRTALTKLAATGMPIVQIVTRAEGLKADYVGIDNYAAGRTAALLMTRMQQRQGTVAVLCHSQIYSVQRDRIRGFSDFLSETTGGGLNFAAALFGYDDAGHSADRIFEALENWPDLVGLYNAGGANASVSAVLRKHRRDIFFVGHELTERSAAALKEGVMSIVLDQNPEAQARRAIDLVLSRLGLVGEHVSNDPIRFVTITSENL